MSYDLFYGKIYLLIIEHAILIINLNIVSR